MKSPLCILLLALSLIPAPAAPDPQEKAAGVVIYPAGTAKEAVRELLAGALNDHEKRAPKLGDALVPNVPSFYSQVASADGYTIVASGKVNRYALLEAGWLVNKMLANRPDVRDAMIQSGSRMCIMAWNEFTTDQPEFTALGAVPMPEYPDLSGKDYWDARARGLGGSEHDPYCSCGEENLLDYPGDPYATECLLIHEFAHNIHLRGLVRVDPTFDKRLRETYDKAMKAGLWKGKYAAANHCEYFAEGVQSWFDDNRENDHDHNHVNTRAELIEYDPGLAAICREVFGEPEWRYTKPTTRLRGHLEGYDPAKAPTFAWPERLQKANDLIRGKARKRNAAASGYEVSNLEGWTVYTSRALLEKEASLTAEAIKLLRGQLEEIVKLVPAAAVTELRKVPLYLSPEYPGVGPRAEYHPDAGWLKDNGRNTDMAKAVEFTNVRTFEAELRRMPNFALHELAHAFHDRFLSFEEPRITHAFVRAEASGKYNSVDRKDSEGRVSKDQAYAMTNHKEFFAELTESFFVSNDFYPFDSKELKAFDPESWAVIKEVWGVKEGQ